LEAVFREAADFQAGEDSPEVVETGAATAMERETAESSQGLQRCPTPFLPLGR